MNSPVLLLLGLLLVVTGACAPAATLAPSAAARSAAEANRRGIELEQRGRSERARTEFRRALQASGAIDDREGMTVALINLARLARRGGELDAAATYLVRAEQLAAATGAYAGEVAFEAALYHLARGDSATALVRANESEVLLPAPERDRSATLLARIHQLRGEDALAEEQALRALKLGAQGPRPEEQANAWRLLGEIRAGRGEWSDAAAAWGEALNLDRQLGRSAFIVRDLRGLQRCAAAQGRTEEAAAYLVRALEVSLYAGDEAGAGAMLAELEALLAAESALRRGQEVEFYRQELLRQTRTPRP